MPKPQWKPVEELTPFARLIREGYMWKQTPPLTISDLAERAGIDRQSVWSWLNTGRLPKRETILKLHHATGIPLDDLLTAAGLPTVDETLARRRKQQRVVQLMVERMKAAVMADTGHFTPEQQRMILAWLDKQPEEFLAGADIQRALAQLATPEAMPEATTTTETAQPDESDTRDDQRHARRHPSDGPMISARRPA